MCGRYSNVPSKQQIAEQMPAIEIPELPHYSYNIAPTHAALVLTADAPARLQHMEWGLVPHWSRDGKNSGKLINARAEGIEDKPSFRDPIHRRRCVVPADSFYEWKHLPGGRKAPYRIMRTNGELLFMAGIWDEWRGADGIKRTFSIITTAPNAEMSALHNRMPALLVGAAARERWLSELPVGEALEMLHPAPDQLLKMYPVSEKLNKPGYDKPDLHEAVAEEWRLF